MKPIPFIGRKKELSKLNDLLSKKIASLVVVKGRRRIGKSRLIEEFAKNKKYYIFSGIPPVAGTTLQSQLDEFSRQLSEQTGLPEVTVNDWSKLFHLLADKTRYERTIILLDEISWMGSMDPNFLGKLKNAWDLSFKKNPELILILCGSVSYWIEKNIISSTGFLGRISLKITLEELHLSECNELLNHIGFTRSTYEKFELLSVTGGIPHYMELINPKYSAMENIKQLCFEKDGILTDEFRFIFHDLFGRRGDIYQDIVECLSQGPADYADLACSLKYTSSGALSQYLQELIISGFISRDYTWSLKTGKESSRLSKFRLSDNYVRFYLKYINPELNQIKKGQFSSISLMSKANYNTIMGLQFENLVLNNRLSVIHALGLKSEEVLSDNPFFQNKTTKQKGCQIDYLIQTRHNTLFACEIKFHKKAIDTSVITSIKEKISRLVIPRGFSCLPVLLHSNGVSDEVIEADYFFKVIDFGDLLTY